MIATSSASRPIQRRSRRAPREVWRFVFLCLEALVFLAPVYWMVTTSLKPEWETISRPVQWVPANPTLENYAAVLTSPSNNLLLWTWNSLLTASAVTVVHLVICTLAAYAFARMRFRGREVWFWVVLSSMMVPGIVTLIPSFIMMLRLGWVDTYHALVWPCVAGAFGVFMLRQFFLTIPRDLEEAAIIDGANSLQVLRHVILPLSIPALVTLSVFTFLGSWNNYVWPMFVVHGKLQTLPVGISNFSGQFAWDYGKLMAGTAVAAIPIIVVYLLAQRYFVQGITLTGLKE